MPEYVFNRGTIERVPDPRRDAFDSLAAEYREWFGLGVMTSPDFSGTISRPASVADQIMTLPDQSPLREILGCKEGDTIVSCQSKPGRVMLRLCGSEDPNGTSKIKATVKIAARPAGRLATLASRFVGREPRTDLDIIAWRGTGLLEP